VLLPLEPLLALDDEATESFALPLLLAPFPPSLALPDEAAGEAPSDGGEPATADGALEIPPRSERLESLGTLAGESPCRASPPPLLTGSAPLWAPNGRVARSVEGDSEARPEVGKGV
jgi:hypothetical protein